MTPIKTILKGPVFYVALALLVFVLFFYGYSKLPPIVKNQGALNGMYSGSGQPSLSPSSSPIPTSTTHKPTISASPTISSSKVINVPFTVQAPYGIWDKLHNEACEEASILMADAWITGRATLPQDYAEQEIQKLTQWGLDHYNSYDTSAAQTAKMAEAVYSIKSRLIKNPTVVNIKQEIDQGHIVIMGMSGQMLDNPYFKSPGPIYHMLVIKGYDATGFVVNDSGTRHGEGFHYSYDNLMQSAHDWPGSAEGLNQSPAVAMVFSK